MHGKMKNSHFYFGQFSIAKGHDSHSNIFIWVEIAEEKQNWLLHQNCLIGKKLEYDLARE